MGFGNGCLKKHYGILFVGIQKNVTSHLFTSFCWDPVPEKIRQQVCMRLTFAEGAEKLGQITHSQPL